MKTYNGIYDRICDVGNIMDAIANAAKGKKHKHSVRKVLADPVRYAKMISEQLKNETWRPPRLHHAHDINDGIQMKKRIIVTPNFIREQIVHHALINVIAQMFLKKFYRWSCGSVPGRGQEEIVRMLRKKFGRSRRSDFKYVCKMDISKFFNSISPLAIFREVRRTISDRKTLLLISRILRSNETVDNCGNRMKGGIPIGFFTSPWFANIALSRIDHLIKDRFGIKTYARYMDDMILFHGNKRELRRCCEAVEEELKKMGLKLKYPIAVHRFGNGRSRMVRFTGFSFDSLKVYIHDRVFLKARRVANRMFRKRRLNWRSFTVYDAKRIISSAARFRIGDTYRAFAKYVLHGNRISVSKCRKMVSRDDSFRNVIDRMKAIFRSVCAKQNANHI